MTQAWHPACVNVKQLVMRTLLAREPRGRCNLFQCRANSKRPTARRWLPKYEKQRLHHSDLPSNAKRKQIRWSVRRYCEPYSTCAAGSRDNHQGVNLEIRIRIGRMRLEALGLGANAKGLRDSWGEG